MVKQKAAEFFSLDEALVAKLENDLRDLLGTFSGDRAKSAETANLLVSKYSENHRAYHNLSHENSLLRMSENFKDKFADYDAVRLAVWFHDAIYEPQEKTNEIESARLAVKTLAELNFPQAKIERVEKMILATQKHAAAGLDADGQMFLDLDLGILGAREEIYKKYAEAIRKEYSFAPENLYRAGRRAVLESFLQRESIYYTSEMRRLHEERARVNIANEIKELS